MGAPCGPHQLEPESHEPRQVDKVMGECEIRHFVPHAVRSPVNHLPSRIAVTASAVNHLRLELRRGESSRACSARWAEGLSPTVRTRVERESRPRKNAPVSRTQHATYDAPLNANEAARQPARPRGSLLCERVAPRVARKSELRPREQIGLPGAARACSRFAHRAVRYRAGRQLELLRGTEQDLPAYSSAP